MKPGDRSGTTRSPLDLAGEGAGGGCRRAVACALGGILNDESVPQLRCRIVAGAANNQLATDAIADLLARRGILWAPDFVANAGA